MTNLVVFAAVSLFAAFATACAPPRQPRATRVRWCGTDPRSGK